MILFMSASASVLGTAKRGDTKENENFICVLKEEKSFGWRGGNKLFVYNAVVDRDKLS